MEFCSILAHQQMIFKSMNGYDNIRQKEIVRLTDSHFMLVCRGWTKMVIYAADIGSIKNKNFGWSRLDIVPIKQV